VTILADLLAALAIGILNWWSAREDLRNVERGRMALRAATLAARALAWKADHPVPPDADLDGPAGLRVREDAGTLTLPTDRPGSP